MDHAVEALRRNGITPERESMTDPGLEVVRHQPFGELDRVGQRAPDSLDRVGEIGVSPDSAHGLWSKKRCNERILCDQNVS